MKKATKYLDPLLILIVASVLGFFTATAKDRVRFIISIVPIMVALILIFRKKKS